MKNALVDWWIQYVLILIYIWYIYDISHIYISHIYIYIIYMVYDIYDIYIYILWYDIWYIYDYMLMITVYGRFLQCGYSTSCMVDSGKIRTQKWMRTGGIPLWLRKPPLVGRPINQLICFYTVWDRIGICLMSPGLSIGVGLIYHLSMMGTIHDI